MKKCNLVKSLVYFTAGFLIVLVFSIYYAFMYQGKPEKIFLASLERKASESKSIRVSEVEGGDWNRVCLVTPYSSTKNIKYVNSDAVNFYYALLFFKGDSLIKKLSFKPEKITSNGVEMPSILISQTPYRFVSGRGDECLDRREALFIAEDITTGCCGVSNEIIFMKN